MVIFDFVVGEMKLFWNGEEFVGKYIVVNFWGEGVMFDIVLVGIKIGGSFL